MADKAVAFDGVAGIPAVPDLDEFRITSRGLARRRPRLIRLCLTCVNVSERRRELS